MNSTLKKAVTLLEQGKVMLYPTDTVWGIGGNAFSKKVATKIAEIKNRDAGKGFIILMKDLESVANVVDSIPEKIKQLLNDAKHPTTVIYPLKDVRLQHLASEENTIAIRIPKEGFVKDFLEECSFPLISTSANKAGKNAPQSFVDIDDAIFNEIDITVGAQYEVLCPTEPSHIVKVNDDGSLERLR